MFTQILTDTAFAFLPALVCWSTFRNFGGSPVIGIVLGLMLVSPSLPSAYDIGSGAAEPLRFLGFITVSGYQGSVLPAFVTGIITAKFEKWLRRHVPDAIDLIVTPFITLLVGIMIALFALGPILHSLESVVLIVVENLLNLPMGIGGLLYGSFGQLLGIFGIHHILNFLEISMLANDGWNYLNPIGTCGNVAQAGAVLAVAIKATSNKTKQVAFPSCLSALLGITEPAVFGVNLKLVTPFVCSMIGGGVGGFLSSLLHLRATGMSITGIPGTLLYLNEQLPFYILTNIVAFAVSFVLTWIIWKEIDNRTVAAKNTKGKNSEMAVENTTASEKADPVIYAPVSGEVVALSEIPDKTFASGILGDGVGIHPSNGKVVAPFDGIISATTETSHAIGVTGENGAELLIHIGVDTVAMQGKGFKTLVKDGQKVVKGQNLIEFDIDEIKKAGYPDTVAILVGNTSDFAAVKRLDSGKVTAGDELLSIE